MIEVPSAGLFWTKNIALPSSLTMLVYFSTEAPSDGFSHELTFSFLPQLKFICLIFLKWSALILLFCGDIESSCS